MSNSNSAPSVRNLAGSETDDAPATIGYVRLSQESDRSIDGQKADIRNYCDRHDLALAGILNEGTRTSGFDGANSREKYNELRRLVRESAVGAVVVRDLSRLSRDQHDRLRLLLDLDERGVELHSVERGVVDTTDYNLAIEAMKATTDDVGKRKEIERSRREVDRRLAAGYYHGRPPFGLQFDDRGEHLEPGDDYQTALDIIDAHDDGRTYREIAEQTGVNRTTVGRIVNNRERYEAHR